MLTSAKMRNNIFTIIILLCSLGFKPSQCCSYYCDASKERACFDNISGTADHLCNGFLGCVAVNKPCAGVCLPRYPVLSRDGKNCQKCTVDGRICPQCTDGEVWCGEEQSCKPRRAACGGKCPSLLYPGLNLIRTECHPCGEHSRWCKEERKCYDAESEPCNQECDTFGFKYCRNTKQCQKEHIPCGGGSTIYNGGPRSPLRQEEHDLCNTEIDTIVRTNDGSVYVFKADKYWKLAQKGIAQGYPRKIEKDWTGLPDNIDAAVSWKTNRKLFTYFFKGDKFWKFTDQIPSQGYPKNIREWGGLPKNLDGALELVGNGDLYFFKGSQYWKYSKKQRSVYLGYPKQITSNWKNVPDYIDAVFQSNDGKIAFFKSEKSFQRQNLSPKNAGQMWFGCPEY